MNRYLERERVPFTMIENALIDSTDVTAYEKLAFIVLCRFADNNTGKCFPSYSKIATRIGCTRKTAVRAIEGLVTKGFIERTARYRDDGSITSNMYTVKVIHRGARVPDTLGVIDEVPYPSVPDTQRINTQDKKTQEEKEEGKTPAAIIDDIKLDETTMDLVSEFQAQFGDDNFRTVFAEYKAAKKPAQYRFVDEDLPEYFDRFRAQHRDEKWQNGYKVGHYDGGRFIPDYTMMKRAELQ